MSSILFLASPRPFELPVEIESYNNRTIFEEPWCGFDISETDKYWVEIIKPIITLPYVYEVTGLGNQYFFVYLEKYFAEGYILELYEIPVQNWYNDSIQRALEYDETITIDLKNYVYQNHLGTFQLNRKNLVEDLEHRTLVTERGVTTIVK